MSGGRLLIPNIAAEEGPHWRNTLREPVVIALARLWRLLYGSDTQLLETDSHRRPKSAQAILPEWPSALGALPEGPVFDWLDAPARATASDSPS